MTDGFYWYLPAIPDEPTESTRATYGLIADRIPADLRGGVGELVPQPFIVQVFNGDRIAICGGELSYGVNEALGRFTGPITEADTVELARLSALVQGMAPLWQQIEWAGDNDGFACCVFCGALNGSTLAHHSDCEWVKMQAEFTRVKTEGAP